MHSERECQSNSRHTFEMLGLRIIFEWVTGYGELVFKRTDQSVTKHYSQRDIWEGSCIDNTNTPRGKLIDWIKCNEGEHDAKTAEKAGQDSYLLTQAYRQGLWNEEKFGKETGEKSSLINEEKCPHTIVRKEKSGLATPAKLTDVDPQNKYGSNIKSHSWVRGQSPGTNRTKIMDIEQKILDKEKPSQFERRDGEIHMQTKTCETDNFTDRGRKNVKVKSTGHGTLRAEAKTEGKWQHERHGTGRAHKKCTPLKHKRHSTDQSDRLPDDNLFDDDAVGNQLSEYLFTSKTLKLMDKALVRIPDFDPHNKSMDIHTHIATVEEEAMIRGLMRRDEKASLLKRSLHKDSIPWVKSLPHKVRNDFKQLSLAVIRKFGEYSTLTEGFYAVKSMTQGMDQDPRDYLVQFKRAYYAGDVNQYHEGDKMFKIMFFESLSPEITERVRMVLNPETASLRRIESKAYMAWLYRAKNHNSDPEHRERDKEPSLSERNKNHRSVPPCREQQKRTHTWQNNPERGWHEKESGTKPNIQENRRRERFRTEPYQHPIPRHTQGSNYAQRWQDNHLAGRCYTDRGGMDANIQENRRMGGQPQSIQFRPIPPPAIPGGNRGITQNAVQIHDKQPTGSASERPTRAPPAEVLNPELNGKYRQAASDRAGKNVDSAPVNDARIEYKDRVALKRDRTVQKQTAGTRPEERRHEPLNGKYPRETKNYVDRSAKMETNVHDISGMVLKSNTLVKTKRATLRGTELNRHTDSANVHVIAERANASNQVSKWVVCANSGYVQHNFSPHTPTTRESERGNYKNEPENRDRIIKVISGKRGNMRKVTHKCVRNRYLAFPRI
ncbi:uncharacterized protein LOC133357753 [Lethenteron reissneri]|uniref:uncharacterized protein LOC133357753 n=1 Tax=Lethenteron reissneri TaxID=7753 RepID=UPI002AB76C23|nr:uncharacterized protein LOC133357753 [Lethenteron reissneri]